MQETSSVEFRVRVVKCVHAEGERRGQPMGATNVEQLSERLMDGLKTWLDLRELEAPGHQ